MGICDCIINILYYLNMPFFSPFISTSAREGLQKTERFLELRFNLPVRESDSLLSEKAF